MIEDFPGTNGMSRERGAYLAWECSLELGRRIDFFCRRDAAQAEPGGSEFFQGVMGGFHGFPRLADVGKYRSKRHVLEAHRSFREKHISHLGPHRRTRTGAVRWRWSDRESTSDHCLKKQLTFRNDARKLFLNSGLRAELFLLLHISSLSHSFISQL